MALTDKIQERIQQLPVPLQAEVLDFIEFLLTKARQEATEDDEDLWNHMSLSLAMCGMEGEDSPQYTPADLKVVFS